MDPRQKGQYPWLRVDRSSAGMSQVRLGGVRPSVRVLVHVLEDWRQGKIIAGTQHLQEKYFEVKMKAIKLDKSDKIDFFLIVLNLLTAKAQIFAWKNDSSIAICFFWLSTTV